MTRRHFLSEMRRHNNQSTGNDVSHFRKWLSDTCWKLLFVYANIFVRYDFLFIYLNSTLDTFVSFRLLVMFSLVCCRFMICEVSLVIRDLFFQVCKLSINTINNTMNYSWNKQKPLLLKFLLTKLCYTQLWRLNHLK